MIVGASVTVPSRPSASRSNLFPFLGFLLAAAVIFARRPDVLIHPEMFAEDARIYYQDVYNLGLKRTLILPQAGYFQTFSVLTAWVARFFSLAAAPFVMALFALTVQALPVGLLLSRRAQAFAPDLRVRIVIAVVYLLLPNGPELDATMVNAQWFLAVAALIVVLLGPPAGRWMRLGDGAILLLSATTGPFVLILAPVAWIRRYLRGDDHVRRWEALMLSACFVLQVIALAVISHHDASNPAVEPRPSPSLGATPALFAKMVGGRVLLGTVLGESTGMTAAPALQWGAIAFAIVVVLLVLRAQRFEVLAGLALAGFVLAGALINPSTASPAWPLLTTLPPSTQRYFFLAEFAWAVTLVWIAATATRRITRLTGWAVVAAVILVAAIGHWSFPAEPPDGFSVAAHRFEAAPNGTSVSVPAEPSGWSMLLVKR
jgi:hypothetical protein